MTELLAHLAARGDPRGPVHDQRCAHATEPRVALPQAQRRVPGPRPAPCVVVVRAEAAEIVDVREVLVEVLVESVHEAVLVDGAVRTTLRAGSVVGQQTDQRVVEEVVLAQVLDDATDLVIGVREEAREHLHHPRVEALLVGRERIPFRDPRRPRRELGAGGNDSGGDLPREQLRAPRVPARVELAGVRRDPLVGDLMRRVHRARREPGEERLARRRLLLVLQHPDRLIGEVLGEVIAVGRFPRRLDRVVVDLQLRRPLVRVAAEEAVEAFETEAEWPAIERARRTPLRARRQVPLADGVRASSRCRAGAVRASPPTAGCARCTPRTEPRARAASPCRPRGGCDR